jgi:hypothetical protein
MNEETNINVIAMQGCDVIRLAPEGHDRHLVDDGS